MNDTNSNRQQRHPRNASARNSRSPEAPAIRRSSSQEQARAQSVRLSESPGPRQFLFIDASTDRNTSGEAVRVHVMREAHRTRRERVGNQGQPRSRRTAAQDEMVILDFRSGRQTSTTPPTATTTTTPAETRAVEATSEPPAPNPALAPAVDWPAVIRAGVSNFSLESMHELYRIAEDLRSIRLVQPDVLQLCKGDFLSLCAYLALASLQLVSADSDQANVSSGQFEARALELLRLRITQTARMHTDTTLVAVLLLSRLEEHKSNLSSAEFHRNALQRLVRDRGGIEKIREENSDLSDVLAEGGF